MNRSTRLLVVVLALAGPGIAPGERERIWVVTPYFVPDEILVRALDLAARRGVDVRVVVPNRSNHLSADLARVGYLRQVDEAGGRVLRYKPAMVHAKVVIIGSLLKGQPFVAIADGSVQQRGPYPGSNSTSAAPTPGPDS